MTIINNNLRLKETRKQLRNCSTSAEKYLWEYLKGSKFHGIKFRRQHSIGRYILDFYCTKYKIAIEIDGDVHIERREYDNIRTEYLNACGIHVIRYTNDEVLYDIDNVLKKLYNLFS